MKSGLLKGSLWTCRLSSCIYILLAVTAASPASADILFLEDFENPVVPSYSQGITPDIWVRAAAGFGSGDHGLTDKSGGDFTAPAGNDQAYAFRYTNSGITTAEGFLGPPLAAGGGYEVSFDVVRDDGQAAGTPYNVKLIAFGAGAARHDCRSIPSGSTQLASTTGNAPGDGSIATVSFTFIPDDVTHAAEFGKDLGIRFVGSSTSAIVDNVQLRMIPGSGPFDLVTTDPVDDATAVRATDPVRMIFSEEIAAGSGNITIRDLTDPLSPIDTVIPAADPQIVISGVCLEIQPSGGFEWAKDYAILVDPDAIESLGGTPFPGIAAETEWNFAMLGGDPLFYSVSQLKDHINGVITLSAGEIDQIKQDLDSVAGRFSESAASITALLDLVETYDTVLGPLWVARALPNRDNVTNDLHWTMFNVMQNIMDRIYTDQALADHEALLDGFEFGSAANFPGPCDPPANPSNVHTVTIDGSFPESFGRDTQQWTLPARKPTGTYLSPGTLATVTVPPELVGSGYKIRVGCHSWDLSGRKPIKRLDRITRVYGIDAEETKVANPLGGGIYIEVPFGANVGPVEVTVTGAVRSPFYSAKTFHQTTPEEWLVERAHTAPWADFQSDKFMTQVPTKWIYNHPDPAQMMSDWDDAMDAIDSLMGFPADRGKETMYCQVDIIMRSSVHAPGYPAVNVTGNPNSDSYGGYRNNYLVRGPGDSPTAAHIEFHEQGHAYGFPKFGGESESNVNLLQAAQLHRKFGYDIDTAHRGSFGFSNVNRTLDNTAVAWMCSFGFSPREVPMDSAEKSYQLKGHAKFMDIARLFGWEGLDAYWRSFMEDDADDIPYGTGTDDLLLRLSRNVGRDIRPLFHFWGIHPQNPDALAAAIATESIPPSSEIRDLLLHYKTIVPADNAAFQTWAFNWWGKVPNPGAYWTETEHARQYDENDYFSGYGRTQQRAEITTNEKYIEVCADQVRDRVQELVDLYFPSSITPNPMTFAIAPSVEGANTIGMIATTAAAATGPIEYYFENTTSATNSGWITSPNWSVSGLSDGASYTFRVKARDGLENETDWSAELSATASAAGDVTPPSPNPMSFAQLPDPIDETSISMTATTASDINDVEYFFECTAGGGNDSGWQDELTYTDTDLLPDTEYTYVVRARDKSAAQNTTDDSDPASANTGDAPDITSPEIISLDPANGSLVVDATTNLIATFDEPVVPGSGFITLKNLTDATETLIDVNDGARVSFSGAVVTIDPVDDLIPGKTYAVQIETNAIADVSSNPFLGISDDSIWSFTAVLENPVANPGGPYGVPFGGTLSLDGGASVPSTGQVLTTWEWDLDNDGDFDEAITGATPASITHADLQATYGMTIGANTIKLRVTDDSSPTAKTSTVEGTVTLGSPLVIDEHFDDVDSTLAGNTPGAGLTGTWNSSGASVQSGPLFFGALARAGNKVSASNNWGSVSVGSPLGDAGLLDDGAELWFSVVVRTGSDIATNGDFGFVLGTDRISSGNNIPMQNGGQALGLRLKDNQLRSAHWSPSIIQSSGGSVSPNSLYLFVGKFTWGATEDTIELYNVAPDLTLGSQVSTYTTSGNLDQKGDLDEANRFDTISFGSKSANPSHLIDAIRFGASAADVLPVDADDPQLVSVSPVGVGDPPGGDDSLFRAIFDEPIVAGSGSIIFRNAGDDTVYTTIAVSDAAQVSFDGANVDITPTLLPVPGNSYYIEFDTETVEDPAGNPFAGFSGSSIWSFTADSTAPVATITDDSVNGEVFLSLQPTVVYTLTFDEVITTPVTTADFEILGTAGASVDSVNQTSGDILEVTATAANVGTMTLSVKASASFSDMLGNTLNGPFSDADTVTVRDINEFESQLGILDLTANGGVNPATGNLWQIGDTYRLAFVTEATTLATSVDIATYNAFVEGEAAASTTFANLGSVTWKAIASADGDGETIAAVDARTNTSTNPSVDGTGEAIYLMNGSSVFATNYSDFWDGTANPNNNRIERTQNNILRQGNFPNTPIWGSWTAVWTGTGGSGTASSALGNTSNERHALMKAEPQFWISRSTADGTAYSLPMYALSDPLTVQAAGSGAPEIVVWQPAATDILNGGSKDFGSVALSENTSLEFTVRNAGTADLNLTGAPLVDITGTNATDFTVTVDPASTVSAGGSTTFTVEFAPSATGTRSATLSIANNDSDENPFTINVTGTGSASDPFDSWALTGTLGAVTFDGDTNGDGVQDGLAWLLGAANPDDDANGLLPTVTESGGDLVLTFTCLNDTSNGTAVLNVQHSSDLGISDAWASVVVPDETPDPQASDVSFTVTPNAGDADFNDVTATIGSGEAVDGKLFGRLGVSE